MAFNGRKVLQATDAGASTVMYDVMGDVHSKCIKSKVLTTTHSTASCW